jgi:hypothetical protein
VESRERSQKVEGEMWGPDGRFDTSLYRFESASGVAIFEIVVRVGASGKAKRTSEAFVVN